MFMIDIEATGVDLKTDEVLEVGIVEIDFDGRYWVPGRTFQTFVHSERQPTSEFAIQHMTEVYRNANAAPAYSKQTIRECIINFLASCGCVGHGVQFAGWNASNFDLPMMHAAGLLIPPGYATVDGKDTQVGDHHYRIYELGGAVQLVCDLTGREYKDVCKEAQLYEMPMPGGKEHDALYDCFKQIKIMNGLIQMTRNFRG